MTRREGRKQTPETRAKIGAAVAAARAAVREQGLPEKRQCVKCKKYKKVGRDFAWRKRDLVNGDVSWIPYPRCKDCEKKRLDEYRKRVGKTELRKRYKVHHENRKRRKAEAHKVIRVPKEPFLEFVANEKERVKWTMVHDVSQGDVERRVSASSTSGPGKPGKFDVAAFCVYMGITEAEYATIQRIGRAGSEVKTVNIELVDRVLTTMGRSDQVVVLYPDVSNQMTTQS